MSDAKQEEQANAEARGLGAAEDLRNPLVDKAPLLPVPTRHSKAAQRITSSHAGTCCRIADIGDI